MIIKLTYIFNRFLTNFMENFTKSHYLRHMHGRKDIKKTFIL